MRVTTWAEYGLIVSLNLAKRAGQGPVAARELAEQERLPHDYVEQILRRLRRGGLVESVRVVQHSAGLANARAPDQRSAGRHLARRSHARRTRAIPNRRGPGRELVPPSRMFFLTPNPTLVVG